MKQTSFIPVTASLDMNSRPVGYVSTENDEVVLKLNKKFVSIDDLNSGKVLLAPSYVVNDKGKDLIEVAIASFSLVHSDSENKS